MEYVILGIVVIVIMSNLIVGLVCYLVGTKT